MIVSLGHQLADDEIMAVADQLAQEAVDLDAEQARTTRKMVKFIVAPMAASPAERWRTLAVRIGMRVSVVFEDVTAEIAIPRFEPAA